MSPVQRYEERPRQIDAIEWTGKNQAEIEAFLGQPVTIGDLGQCVFSVGSRYMELFTGWYLVRDVAWGHFDIFFGATIEKQYAPLPETP